MEDTLVTYPTAELANTKGFNIQTYINCWLKTLDGHIIHNSERRNIFEHDRCKQYLMQPSQSMLCKWLRDVHNIHIIMSTSLQSMDNPIPMYTYKIMIPKPYYVMQAKDRYYSFEDTLELALQDALKLIP